MKRLLMCTFCTVSFLLSMNALAVADFSPANRNDPYEPKFIPVVHTGNSWFVGAGGGYDWVFLGNKTNTLVNNVAGSAADTFTLSESSQSSGVVQAFVGYRWDVTNSNYLSLQLNYEHISQITASGQRIPIALPSFASTYSYDVGSQALLLIGQFNFLKWHALMPFVQAGIGISKNSFSNFSDNNVLTMPPFPNASQYNWSSVLGAGVDVRATQHILFNLAYRFGWLGDVRSGTVSTVTGGAALPAPIQLSNSLTSQQILASLTYLFDGGRG